MDIAEQTVGVNTIKDDVGERVQKLFQDFLEEFRQEDGELKYLAEALTLMRPERNTLRISFIDVEHHNQALSTAILEEYYRVYPYICRALRNFAHDHGQIPTAKEFYVSFTDVSARQKVRELTTAKIGAMLRITGQVVRTHPVHPELISGTFTCLDCQTTIKDVEQQFKYTQPSICRNPVCNNRSRFLLDVNKSVFVDFQKVRIQETQAELPRGSIPRSVEIILRAETVESAQAGDKSDFTGCLIVVPDVGSMSLPGSKAELKGRQRGQGDNDGVKGLKSLGVRELTYRLSFLACNVTSCNNKFGEIKNEEQLSPEVVKSRMSASEWQQIYEMSTDKNLYSNLCNSLFPSIYGNDEVKRGILLMLLGGVPKQTPEGTRLRGDINICVVGDPSTAKSQFLVQVEQFSPRAIYTSGKASTAAGLTAAVVRDEETYEFVIEAGALMLADNGICCIDEFDKMDLKDQVAIHEAMEQQTISITKAGVKATLNARASILAAANPIGGRYDRTKSLKQNISLSAPIMSRFDLFFIIVDQCNEVTDYAIAKRILDLHNYKEEAIERIYSVDDIQRYILFARQFKPKISLPAQKFMVEEYKRLRQRDASAKTAWRITVRQLESMIRLSEAMARLGCLDQVHPKHVKEAFRLLNKSIIRVVQPDIHFEDDEIQDVTEPVAATESMDIDQSQDLISGTQESEKTASKQTSRITYDEYKHMANYIVCYMRRREETIKDDDSGVKKSDLINWYLHQIEGEIDSEQELIDKKTVAEKIIYRLIHHDHILIELDSVGLKPKVATQEKLQKDEDPILVVHPNYVIDV